MLFWMIRIDHSHADLWSVSYWNHKPCAYSLPIFSLTHHHHHHHPTGREKVALSIQWATSLKQSKICVISPAPWSLTITGNTNYYNQVQLMKQRTLVISRLRLYYLSMPVSWYLELMRVYLTHYWIPVISTCCEGTSRQSAITFAIKADRWSNQFTNDETITNSAWGI